MRAINIRIGSYFRLRLFAFTVASTSRRRQNSTSGQSGAVSSLALLPGSSSVHDLSCIMILLRLISCIVLVLFLTPCLSAQTATLRGQITDESGALVPAADVTQTGSDGHTHVTKPDGNGFYFFTALLAGKYTVQASAPKLTMRQPATVYLKPGVRTLNLQLSVVSMQEKITVQENTGPSLSTDSESNASALVLRGDDLQALSDDSDDLQEDLQGLSEHAAGPNGGQIFIDGGRLPSKQSIREVRINQSPFAAQSARPGRGHVEVFTKPGKDAFHGQLLFQFSDAAINSRNPFVSVKPPYQRRQWEGRVHWAHKQEDVLLHGFRA